jgi:uncharacterized membrane protein
MMGVLLFIIHAISMTLALAIFISIHRRNSSRGKWFLTTILLWGGFSLYKIFNYSFTPGILTVLLYVMLLLLTVRTLINEKQAG